MEKGTTVIHKKTNKSYTYGKRGRKPLFVQDYEKSGDTTDLEIINPSDTAIPQEENQELASQDA